MLTLRVTEAQSLNPLVRQFRLARQDGGALPGFSAGAHIQVQVTLPDGSRDWRHYSLINPVAQSGVTDAPTEYRIAVRREDEGRGGSRFMHEVLQAGQELVVQAPKNDFPLHDGGDCAVLVAGGIGITPMLSMAAQRCAQGAPVRMHYAGRSRSLMAFLPELGELLGERLDVHADDEAGRPLDIGALLDRCAADERLYVCGPKVMLDAVLAAAQSRGWNTHERIHFELFTTPEVEEGDQPIELVLAQSGKTLTVPADQTILDCLIDNGCDPMFDCKRGECGVCATPVIEGDIDHRDYVLTAREKAEGNVMQICISRCKGKRLVLDI
ncbi:PDR/VanB family oxidoreductase [Variovorax dokdonensis]|uniref:PDR/VanB family oxidoreductase n=2 Tax=Variovorax dokdonensis TaxID=344883 RepID=A0ABT7N8B6_9BURK|nr:PDR/VanB family oxidoreductase [Variovorax dokdonensis]MDM0044125.1 PDR/VanB family oxidoreductase [Variovorax dokdonensis]